MPPGILRRSFLRVRNTFPSPGDEPEEDDECRQEDTDECWNPWYAYGLRHRELSLTATWGELLAGTGIILADRVPGVDWAHIPVKTDEEAPRQKSLPIHPLSSEELPVALLERLNEMSMCQTIPLVPTQDLALMELAPFREIARKYEAGQWRDIPHPSCVGGMVIALYLWPFWVRDPADFVVQDGDLAQIVGDLMEHLFAVHPVAPCFRNAWLARWDDEVPQLTWIAWFILAAQGASVHRAGPKFGWKVSQTLLRHLEKAPASLSPIDGILWADITRLGGNEIEMQRLRNHAGYAYSPVYLDPHGRRWHGEPPHEFGDFWEDTVRWLARHRANLTDEMCDLILPWALQFYTAQMHGGQHFSWKGRTPARAHRLAQIYEEEINTPHPHLRWSRMGRDWTWQSGDGTEWSMKELVTSKDLLKEGNAMSHCVASYAMRCVQELSAIFSLRKDGARRLTVEVNPQQKCLVQARGLCNETPTEEESARLAEWLACKLPESPGA